MSSKRVGIVGAGVMGSGIALAAFQTEAEIRLFDVSNEVLEKAGSYVQGHLARKDRGSEFDRLKLVPQIEELSGSDIVIEAVSEDLDLKRDLFQQLDEICPPPALLVTNTSTLSVTSIASTLRSRDRAAGMHFFNPAAVMPLVEVIQTDESSSETVRAVEGLAREMGKTPVVVRDTPGFIVNRVARPFYGEALRLLAEGVASHPDIDRIVEAGGGFQMGPFRLMDLIGIDVNFTAMQSMYAQTFGEPRYRPHWIQQRMVERGALGRKTGKGFYEYAGDPTEGWELPQSEAGSGSGLVLVSPGSWSPGLQDRLTGAGFTLSETHGDIPVAAVIAAGREESALEHLRRFDRGLSATTPVLMQAGDVTLGEVLAGLRHPERVVGFDGLFLTGASVIALIASPVLAGNIRDGVEDLFRTLGLFPIWIEDSPALILPRIVSMLVNEAAFALAENVASESDIDTAMRLGVRYPHGPLEWGKEIGLRRVVAVLDHLYRELGDDRYRVAPGLRRWARSEGLQAGQ